MEKNYNNNIEYWNKRYSEMPSEKVVGNRKWTEEEYKRNNELIMKKIQEIFINNIQIDFNTKFDNVLDFGCGKKFRFYQILKSLYVNYFSCDIMDFNDVFCNPEIESFKHIDNKTNHYRNYFFKQIKDNKIPFDDVSFDLIFTGFVLQHIIDNNLLNNYIKNFYDKTNENSYVLIIENTSPNKSNNYISFRNNEDYKILFETNGFIVKDENNIYLDKEKHSIILFKKSMG